MDINLVLYIFPRDLALFAGLSKEMANLYRWPKFENTSNCQKQHKQTHVAGCLASIQRMDKTQPIWFQLGDTRNILTITARKVK